jgi:hypothetical protein
MQRAAEHACRASVVDSCEWSAATWISGLHALPQIVATALMEPLGEAGRHNSATLEYVRALGGEKVDVASVALLLTRGNVLQQLASMIAEAAAAVAEQPAATALELHHKFSAIATAPRVRGS